MKEYKYWPTGDLIRVVATFAVLFIHVTQYSIRNSASLDIAWWSLNIGQSLSIWAVPAFIMLSGALLLSPQSFDETPIVFYKKRLLKIGIPLLFWGILYFFLEKRWNPDISFESLINLVWIGAISWHLSFLFAILGLYIITPWLRFIINQMETKQAELIWIIMIFLGTTCVDSYIHIFGLWKWHITFRWVSYLGYYLMGRYIVYLAIDDVAIFKIFTVLGLLSNIIGRYFEMVLKFRNISFYYNDMYSSITVILLSIGIFGLMIYWTKEINENSQIVKYCRLLAPSTFGIYLVHVLIIQELHYSFHIQYPNNINIFMALIYSLMLLGLSLLLVYLMGFIPWICSVVSCNTQKILEDNQINIFSLKKYLFYKEIA